MTLAPRDTDKRLDSPPLQGRGRGWGLSANRLAQSARYARAMRAEPTEPERWLWQKLSRSQLGGYKFRRQAVIGSAIADFLCPAKGLIVEVDGWTHDDRAADLRRDTRLEGLGYRVVRVTNEDVMRNLDGVCEMLLSILNAAPDRRPHPDPSPEGEGLSVEAQKLLGISLEGSVG